MIAQATITLRLAEADDLKQLKEYKKLSDKTIPVFEPRYGQVYCLKSKITGDFGDKFYVINENTDTKEIAEWLKNEMIYIPAGELN